MGSAGACIFGCAGPSLSPPEAAFFAEAQPWGFILFRRNVADPAQLRRLTAALREAVGRDAPVLVDQEGGSVQRLGPPHWRAWPPPLEAVHAAGGAAAEAMRARYAGIARELRAVGIDVNCVPCADMAAGDTHPFLRDRCYGDSPREVAAVARAVADALLSEGVLPVLKHLPGHGRALVDSHHALPHVHAPADDLGGTDFAVFRDLADLPLGMTAHVVYDALDPELPATTSPRMIALIRNEIGFDGLLMGDDIAMGALSGSMAERARASLDAGCDVVLHCNGDLAEMEAIAAEAGPMTPEAALRGDRALALRRPADARGDG